MYKIILYIIVSLLSTSCAYDHKIKVLSQQVEKPSLEFSKEFFSKPNIITEDKCYLMNSPKIPVVCMLVSEYDKETRNYRIMLDIIKQYQISDKYHNEIK